MKCLLVERKITVRIDEYVSRHTGATLTRNLYDVDYYTSEAELISYKKWPILMVQVGKKVYEVHHSWIHTDK